MSQIQESTIKDAEHLILSFFSAAVGSISSVSIFTLQALESSYLKRMKKREELNEGGEMTFQKFKDLLRKVPPEQVLSMRVLDEQVDDFRRFLKENHKIFVVVDDLQKDSQIIMFRERDKETIEQIRDLVDTIHNKQTEINPNGFLKAYENQNIGYVSGLNRNELEMFRYYVKGTPCLFAVAQTGEDRFTILHKTEDKDKIKNALHHSNWSLRGSFGEQVKEQIAYHLQGHNKINQNLEDAQKEFYVVSKNNPKNYVHVSEKEITYYKNEKEVSKSLRDDPDCRVRMAGFVDALANPVILQPEEFSKDIVERQNVLDQKKTLNLFPEDMAIEEEMQKYNQLRQLISDKMNLDNENEADWTLYDTAITYSEYDTHEFFDDSEENEYKEKEFQKMKESFKYTEKRFVCDEIAVDRSSLDYIIAQTEQEKATATKQENQKDHEQNKAR